MAGGGQPGNKNAQKWTEEEALKLGEELLSWMKEKPENVFFKEFLIYENDYYEELTDYLSNKYESFLNVLKKAKKIQELKIVKLSSDNKLNPTMSIFCLKNLHDWRDRQDVDHTTKGEAIKNLQIEIVHTKDTGEQST